MGTTTGQDPEESGEKEEADEGIGQTTEEVETEREGIETKLPAQQLAQKAIGMEDDS